MAIRHVVVGLPSHCILAIRSFSEMFPRLNMDREMSQLYSTPFSTCRTHVSVGSPNSITTFGLRKSSSRITDFFASLGAVRISQTACQCLDCNSGSDQMSLAKLESGNRMRSPCFSQCFGISRYRSSVHTFFSVRICKFKVPFEKIDQSPGRISYTTCCNCDLSSSIGLRCVFLFPMVSTSAEVL